MGTKYVSTPCDIVVCKVSDVLKVVMLVDVVTFVHPLW